MSFDGGPYIQTACFCEYVLVEANGVASLIRIIDTVNHQVKGLDAPDDMPPFTWKGKLVIMLKPGKATGRNELKIVPELPNGSTMDVQRLPAYFDGEERGQNFILDYVVNFTLEGLYWFRVYIGDQLITNIPLRVKYIRMPM